MSKIDVKLSYTSAATGKKGTTTISDVNPSATRAALLEFTQGLNALTTNNYVESNRIATTNLDTEDPSPEMEKSFRGIAVDPATRNTTAEVSFNRLSSSEGVTPAVFFYNDSNGTVTLLTATEKSSSTATVGRFNITIPNSGGYLYVGLSESTDFYSEFVRLMIS